MDGLEHDSLGKLAVSFCNPLKEDNRKDRIGKVDPRQVASVMCDTLCCSICLCGLSCWIAFASTLRSWG